MSTKKEKHLYYFHEMGDYKISSKDPDIREWPVKDLDHRTIGKVESLLVNKELGKVVYIDVEVDQSIIDANHDPYSSPANLDIHEFINKEGENHIIIPIGMVDLNTDEKFVYTQTINYQTFAETKRYQHGSHINRDYERNVLSSYNRGNPETRKTRSAYDTNSKLTDAELAAEKKNDSEYRDTSAKEETKADREKAMAAERERERERRERLESSEEAPLETFDEDENWERDKESFDDEEAYKKKKERNPHDDSFYNRKEFNRNR